MQKTSFRKLSLLGLVLMGASAVTAAILPKTDSKKAFNGIQVASTGASGQISCINQSGDLNCTVTASATTTNPNVNGHQTNGTSVVNDGSSASGGFNSSQSPN